jgi:hypothetical protein
LIGSTDGGLTWKLIGKPGTVDNSNFTAACMTFSPKPAAVLGINDSGAWLYNVP